MARSGLFLMFSAALVAVAGAADVPEWAQFNTGRQLLARPPQCDFPVSVGYPVTSYNLIFKGTSNNGTRACWNVAVNNACAQGADRCCLKGAKKTPILKRLIIYPPAGSTCAQKSTRKFVKYTVGGSRLRKILADGTRVQLRLPKLKRAGGEVCVDFAAAGSVAGCSSFSNLCSSSGCRALLWTRKFKRQKGEARKFCCVAFGNTAPPCGPGFYVNGGVCTVCGFGFYCPDGTARLPCGTGETTVTDTSTVESQCVKECTTDADCPTGVGCSDGTCSVCKPGYYPSASSPTGCAECGLGFYCPNGEDRNPCGGGETTTTTTATSDSQCVPGCKTDADCATGVGCSSGTCSVCKPGYYPSASSPTGCAECGLGFYCPNGKDRNPCGGSETTTTTTATSDSECVAKCTTDADCPTGVACSSGTCSACKPGYYPSAAAASGCAECGFGFYCPNGEDRKPCGTGQTTSTTTSTDKSECVPGCKTDADCAANQVCSGGTCIDCKSGNSYIYGIDGAGVVYEANAEGSAYVSVKDLGLGAGSYVATAYDAARQELLFLAPTTRNLYYWKRGSAAATQVATAAQIGAGTTVSNAAYYSNAFWFVDEAAAVTTSQKLVKVPLTYDASGKPTAGAPQTWTLTFSSDIPDSFGDIAISSSGTIYFNTIQYGTGAYFYSLPVASLGAPGSSVSVPQVTSTTAEPLQISMGCDGTTLWGQRYDTCEWFTVNTATGAATKQFAAGGTNCLRDLGGAACTCAASV